MALGTPALAAPIALPPNIVVPNRDRSPIGQIEALESGANIARTRNPSANWYNPAGLAQTRRVEFAAAASAVEWTRVTAEADEVRSESSSRSHVPGFFGVALGPENLRYGASVAQGLSWNPDLQSQFIESQPGGGIEQFTYQVQDSFTEVNPALAVAFSPSKKLRIGLGIACSSVSYRTNDNVSDQLLDSSSLSNFTQNTYIDGISVSLLGLAGVQLDLSKHWKLGLLLRTPGVPLWGSAWVSSQTLTSAGGTVSAVSFYDESADFTYTTPFETGLGVAYVADKFELEADLRYHFRKGPSVMLSSENPVRFTSQVGAAVPQAATEPLADAKNELRNVLNPSIGARVTLTPAIRLHAGGYASYSPVADPASPFFRKIDLYGATLGASLELQDFSGSLGASYEAGSSDPYTVTNALTGDPVQTRVQVSSIRLFYAVSFEF